MDKDSDIFTDKNNAGLETHNKFISGFNSSILLCSNPKCVTTPSKIFNNDMRKLSKIIQGNGMINSPIQMNEHVL